ncbi:PAS domain-containing protein [Lacrimispora sp. NSJ-141]|uniref:PAS domain-containing protein n=1 Tax=Lientehia hominis TaxID=2897778 RepID=A0AAP2RHW7_9FIRM|nr:PAS domain-containing protein [Lientehia hominis]MCD2491975.1 PAS domain-containing protein [Lientehia hominis]
MNGTVEQYIPMVEYIAQVIGRNCEVILHDLSDLNHSVVAVSSHTLTGRKTGDAITDMALMVLHNKSYVDRPFVVNYVGRTKGSPATYRSSTYFIREGSEIVGMLCINIDVSAFLSAREALDAVIMMGGETGVLEASVPCAAENFTVSREALLAQTFENVCELFSLPPERLKAAEKRRFVKELYDRGCFGLKGSVTVVSEWLQISESSVYRYLNEVMRGGQ